MICQTFICTLFRNIDHASTTKKFQVKKSLNYVKFICVFWEFTRKVGSTWKSKVFKHIVLPNFLVQFEVGKLVEFL